LEIRYIYLIYVAGKARFDRRKKKKSSPFDSRIPAAVKIETDNPITGEKD